MLSIPSEPGSYALQLNLSDHQSLRIGSLGEHDFPTGDYIYLGSALGPGGLQARLSRHLRGEGRPHWHIDWLRTIAVLTGYYFLASERRLECIWSQALIDHPAAGVPVPGFGSSDCQGVNRPCLAHLVWFEQHVYRQEIHKVLSQASGSQVTYGKLTSDSQPGVGFIE